MSGDGFFQRAVKEGMQDPSKRRSTSALAWPGGLINKLACSLPMHKMSFDLQYAEQSPYRRAGWRIGKILEHVGCRGLTLGINHIHDLPLAPAQVGRFTRALPECIDSHIG